MKRCPYCEEDIQDGAVKCRWCKEYLPVDLGAKGSESSVEAVKPESSVTSEIDAHLKAGEDFENLAGGIPEAVNHYFLAAQLSLESGNEEDCQSFCEHILELNPNDSRATSLLASIDKDVSTSVPTQERAIDPNVEASAGFYEKAEDFRKSGHPAEAFRCYLEAVKLDPDNRQAHFGVKMYVPDHPMPAMSVQEPKSSKEQRIGSLIPKAHKETDFSPKAGNFRNPEPIKAGGSNLNQILIGLLVLICIGIPVWFFNHQKADRAVLSQALEPFNKLDACLSAGLRLQQLQDLTQECQLSLDHLKGQQLVGEAENRRLKLVKSLETVVDITKDTDRYWYLNNIANVEGSEGRRRVLSEMSEISNKWPGVSREDDVKSLLTKIGSLIQDARAVASGE